MQPQGTVLTNMVVGICKMEIKAVCGVMMVMVIMMMIHMALIIIVLVIAILV